MVNDKKNIHAVLCRAECYCEEELFHKAKQDCTTTGKLTSRLQHADKRELKRITDEIEISKALSAQKLFNKKIKTGKSKIKCVFNLCLASIHAYMCVFICFCTFHPKKNYSREINNQKCFWAILYNIYINSVEISSSLCWEHSICFSFSRFPYSQSKMFLRKCI